MNKLELQAEVVLIEPLRYTPAGIPLLSVVLRHASDQIEAGMKRRVECEVNAVALGDQILGTPALKGLKVGAHILATGFLAKRSLKSTQLVMHINHIEFI
ncbi:MAG: primosomal replication protein N [Methylotenera sp.]|nr:primosomal replication protein N [Methylotenera sp.]MDO9232351.1 primosomal replication protein N [Methylotenera sp.]MDO9388027.1 primosomal replication protein N [Methylotenera sp.]MDP2102119.1 primosomal replication protein N [Methylotenera sp.]MDP2281079.1 primosomal replication protein N [Methylotenera sp.]